MPYNKICATSENSDQTAHPISLIKVFGDRMCLKKDKREPLPYWVDVQTDRSLCWSYCRGDVVRWLKPKIPYHLRISSLNMASSVVDVYTIHVVFNNYVNEQQMP